VPGFLCLVQLELHFTQASTLKEKRKELKSLKTRLQQRFGAAVAETDGHDLWQRSTLICVLVGDGGVGDRGAELCRWVEAQHVAGDAGARRTFSADELLD
jgi:uncharacterized protein YlxP (DUF503 family)